jgi:hypothetical protein
MRGLRLDFGTVVSVALAAVIAFGLAGCAEAAASSLGLVDIGTEAGVSFRLGDITIPLAMLAALVKAKPTIIVEHKASPETIAEWKAIVEIVEARGNRRHQ